MKAQVSELVKPEPLATLVDDYERPTLEKYEPVEIDKAKKEKSTPAIIIPDVKPQERPTEKAQVIILKFVKYALNQTVRALIERARLRLANNKSTGRKS